MLPATIGELARKAGRRAQTVRDRVLAGREIGLRTGLKDLDGLTKGLQPGEVVLLAGRPAMGKTALALSMAIAVARDAGLPVMLYEPNRDGAQIATRLLSALSGIDQRGIRDGRLSGGEWEKFKAAIERTCSLPLYVDASIGLTVHEVRARLRRFVGVNAKLGLVIVDEVQDLLDAAAQSDLRLRNGIRPLRLIAAEIQVPVLIVLNIRSSLEDPGRTDYRPRLADLAEIRWIDEVVDTILFLYRDEVYHDNSADSGIAELIVARHPSGRSGALRLRYEPERNRFCDIEPGT